MLGFDLSNVASLKRFQVQFEYLGQVGSGGFSVVHKVRNKRDHKLYALKIVKIKPSEFKGEIADYLEKVLGQAKVLSGLRHANILQYCGCWIDATLKMAEQSEDEPNQHDQDNSQDVEFVLQEYSQDSCGFEFQQRSSSIEKKRKISHNNNNNRKLVKQDPADNIFGTDLTQYKQIRVYLLSHLGEFSLQKYVHLRAQQCRKNSAQRKRMNIENYRIILDVIEGLSYIHSQKVIHRDIKLQNVIIDSNKKCKIIDFGLAKKVRNLKSMTFEDFGSGTLLSLDECDERHSSSVGTKIFSSPEQTNSENYDYRTDIYSLGMVIGVLMSQYKTAHEEGQLLLNLRNKNLTNFSIDERLKTLLLKCLSEQKYRPELKQIKHCIRTLLTQELEAERHQNKENKQNNKLGSLNVKKQVKQRQKQVEVKIY